MICHLTSRSEWQAARQRGEYRIASLDSEGFIHCSTAAQLPAVANAFYRNRPDLVLLVIDETLLTSRLEWESPVGPGAPGIDPTGRFPHLYGPLNLQAVSQVFEVKYDSEGGFILPAIIEPRP